MTCQEEVFSWFRNLSGPKRIEFMCGLMSMCIPLEIRFFETIVQDLAQKDYTSFRETEIKANSIQELSLICKCDLLSEKTTPDFDDSEINGNSGDSSASNNGSNEPNQILNTFSKYPSRSKLIISLCLLKPTNHLCSSITYDTIRQQLIADNILNAVYTMLIPKNYPLDNLFTEVLLLLTMAVYHPAFSYDQRRLLIKQKEEVEQAINIINSQFRPNSIAPAQPATAAIAPGSGQPANQALYQANPNVTSHHHQHQTGHTQQHSQSASQQVHSYHQTQYSIQHPSGNVSNKSHHIAHIQHQQAAFPIPFIPSHVPIANLTYTPQGPGAASVANQTNAVISNMSLLKVNSPQSTSPSPTISPSSVKMSPAPLSVATASNAQTMTIKLDPMYTTAAGLQPNHSLIKFVGGDGGIAVANTAPPGTIPFMNIASSPHVIIDDSAKSSVSSNASISSSTSCYNCGSIGHRGTECTSTGVDDNH